MTSCRARVTSSANAFHSYICGRPGKAEVEGVSLCGIHKRKLDRSGSVFVWPIGNEMPRYLRGRCCEHEMHEHEGDMFYPTSCKVEGCDCPRWSGHAEPVEDGSHG